MLFRLTNDNYERNAMVKSNYIILLFLLSQLHSGKAVCPNLCSGHGSCDYEATCTCDSTWEGAPDCSKRERRLPSQMKPT
mmetsp:Transcript_11142/g.12750  ORF Transcript_11142/g.12750 Transcript_11142/m.12750 type:complete len:80 (+) Transcript_11142:95-334(+)